MRNNLKKFSSRYSNDYFTDKKNFPNQELQSEIIQYFESGEGKRVYKLLDILNLLEKQQQFVLENYSDENFVITELNKIPLNDLERHVLYGMILKRFGGYPVNNLNCKF